VAVRTNGGLRIGEWDNRGTEAAQTALEMARVMKSLG
jgi:hypothetical protein